MPGFDSYAGEIHKLGKCLICLFVEKLLCLDKICSRRPKSIEKNCPLMLLSGY